MIWQCESSALSFQLWQRWVGLHMDSSRSLPRKGLGMTKRVCDSNVVAQSILIFNSRVLKTFSILWTNNYCHFERSEKSMICMEWHISFVVLIILCSPFAKCLLLQMDSSLRSEWQVKKYDRIHFINRTESCHHEHLPWACRREPAL